LKRWVRPSLRRLTEQLNQGADTIGRTTVKRLLKKHKFGLVSNRKSLTGTPHPDRDRQFRYIKRIKKLFLNAGRPVISVDAKNKELIGLFFNRGRIWRQQPERVNAHDFRQDAVAVAIPYGIYDLMHNQGSVYVSTSHNTSEFAVEAIRSWWNDPSRPRFQQEDALLILCDAGGSNNCRFWLWKYELQLLANQLGISIMVCHYPTGASKYNPIEYRLFSQITINWAGQPLQSLQTMLSFIRDTTTQTGLTVKALLLDQVFQKGRRVSDEQYNSINLRRRPICPTWNYTITPDLNAGPTN
jgi:hypothetical protein